MSMSTRIDDLPGPGPVPIPVISSETKKDISLLKNDTNQNSNIKMDIKKKVHFEDEVKESFENEKVNEEKQNTESKQESFVSFILSQINEENLLLFVILCIITLPETDNYIITLPSVGNYISGSSLLLTIVKALLMLFLFIVSKKYLVPYIKI